MPMIAGDSARWEIPREASPVEEGLWLPRIALAHYFADAFVELTFNWYR